MIRVAVVLIAFFFGCSTAFAQPAIGDPAPEIVLAGYMAAPEGSPVTLAELRDKVVVLEFWATWCAPCIAAIPHLNEVAERVADEPVVFIAVTGERPDAVEKFIQRRPMKAWVGIDENNATAKAYGVRFLPHTVVVGKDGKVLAGTSPESINESVLRDALAGKALGLPVKVDRPAEVDWDEKIGLGPKDPESLGHAILRRSSATGGATRFLPGSGHIQGDGVVWQVLVQLAYDVEPSQVVGEVEGLGAQVFRVSVLAPDRQDETARGMLRALLPGALGIETEVGEEPRRVLVLRRSDGAAGPAPAGDGPSFSSARNGQIMIRAGSMDMLAKYLGGFGARTLGIDETGLEGRFDIALNWTPGDREALEQALAAIGLAVSTETRPVKVVRVTERAPR